MLELVFHDSTKAGLMSARRRAFIHSLHPASTDAVDPKNMNLLRNIDLRRSDRSENRRRFVEQLMAIQDDDRRTDVLGLSLYLDVGDIASDLFGAAREAALCSLFHDPVGADAARELMEANRADRDLLLFRAAQGEPVRIWYSDAPAEMCGFMHAVSLLEGLPCPILAVALPKIVPGDNGWTEYMGWQDVDPDEFERFAEKQQRLDDTACRALAAHWKRLVRENAPLRAVFNGRIHSVPETFYDYLIDQYLPEGEFVEALLIGRILGEECPGISDGWLARRIQAAIDAGRLQIVDSGEEDSPYSRRLRRIG